MASIHINRRGFIGRLLAAVAAPVVPAVAIVQAAPAVSHLAAIGADFDGNVDLGPVGRGMTHSTFIYDEDISFYYPHEMWEHNRQYTRPPRLLLS